MQRLTIMIVAAVGMASPIIASAQTATRGDVAYCNALSDTYVKYIGRDETTPGGAFRSSQGNAAASAAVAECRKGNASAAIPVLERELTNAKFTLPARG